MSFEVKELQTETDIDIVLAALSFEAEVKIRIKDDFDKRRFNGLYATLNHDDSLLGYVIFCDSYSTWQHRIYFCSDVYLNSSLLLTKEKKFEVLKSLFNRLLEITKENKVHRINLNINHQVNREIIDFVCELGAVNLTEKEEWLIFEMGLEQMKEFSQLKLPEMSSDYKLIKLETDLTLYIDQIINLIKEISVFEKMEDQFETSRSDLIKDFKFTENNCRLNLADKISSRFYEVFVMVKGDEVIGYSIYHLKYELKKGLGFYLEEIYITEKYRHQGLGTILWQTVTENILSNKSAKYLHWTVLNWNTNAIEFYFKYKSKNLNECENLNHIRFTKEVIYSK